MNRTLGTFRRAVALTFLLGMPAGATTDGGDDAETIERAFTRAWASDESEKLSDHRLRAATYAENHPESARAHYLLGLVEMTKVLRTNSSPDRADMKRTLAILDGAEAHFSRAFELDGGQADACAANAFCVLQRFVLGQAAQDQGPVLMGWIQKGKEVEGVHSSVELLDAWMSTSRAGTSPQAIDEASERFIALSDGLRARLAEQDQEPSFWDLMGQVMAARALIFSPQPQPGRAAELVEEFLEATPKFSMARRFLLPFVTIREPLDPAGFQNRSWKELGGELEPDGKAPTLADCASVSYELVGDELWIRAQLHSDPIPEVFGINVVVDVDGDQENGTAWWGGNTGFVFDRLVSAWVARDAQGQYRGAVGVTDDTGAVNGEMTNLGDGTVGFAVAMDEGAFILRIPWSALGGGDSSRFLVAVGSNAIWNDDVPNEGSFSVRK